MARQISGLLTALQRLVEQVDDVGDADARPSVGEAGGELQVAARVRRDDDISARGQGVVELAVEERFGRLALGDVVDAGAAATHRALPHLH